METRVPFQQGPILGRCLGPQAHITRETFICPDCGALVAGAILLDTYQVRQLLGGGRTKATYLTEHLPSGQLAVAELLSPEAESEPLWERARREVRIISSLRHPGVLPIFSCTIIDLPRTARPTPFGSRYLLALCAYAPDSLANMLEQIAPQAQARLTEEQIRMRLHTLHIYLSQLSAVLAEAHAHGVIHGALSTEKLLLKDASHLWVADFGLGRLHPSSSLTLPPEFRGLGPREMWDLASPVTDQYMYALLCQQLFSRLLPLPIYQSWNTLFMRALDPTPQRRFASLDEFAQPLLEWIAAFNLRSPNALQAKLQGGHAFSDPSSQSGPKKTTGVLPPVPPVAWRGAETAGDAFVKRAEQAFLQGNFTEAIKAYREALKARNQDASLWVALGDAYVAQETYDLALQAYEQAIALDPNDPQAWSNKAVALEVLGRAREAADCYERAKRLQAERNR